MRKNLVIVRAGNESVHEGWLDFSDRNFDLYISYYGNICDRYSSQSEYYEWIPGLKFPVLSELINRSEICNSYDAIWIPDDDIVTDGETISNMFNLFHCYELWLAQPALTENSFFTYPELKVNRSARLRFVNFVEIMCPIFSRESIQKLGHTFDWSASGWGLGCVWPYLLNYPLRKIAILDKTPVTHSRPVRTGTLYDTYSQLGVRPEIELKRILSKFNLPRPSVKVYDLIEIGRILER